jgi:hypothetical protein
MLGEGTGSVFEGASGFAALAGVVPDGLGSFGKLAGALAAVPNLRKHAEPWKRALAEVLGTSRTG